MNLRKLSLWIVILLMIFNIGCASESVENSQIENQNIESATIKNEESELNEEDASNEETIPSDSFEGYTLIEVDGGNQSGHREPNVVVDIGFADREYYAFTNEHGQLIKVTAKKITLQDEKNEPITSKGRYYPDEAKVPGVESKTLDEGHVIADSLGGVSNAYNITPQNSTLNRHGDQAYMEKVIRDAGGCTDFVAIITYPNNNTQIPSHYSFTYTIKGNVVNDEFDNVNPDEVNKKIIKESKNNTDNVNTKNKVVKKVEIKYIGNANSKKFHKVGCSSVKRMSESNKIELNSRDEAVSKGYDPCKRCNP